MKGKIKIMGDIANITEIPNMRDIKLKKVIMKMDVDLLNSIIAFLYKDSVVRTRKSLSNIYKLFQMIDDSSFEGNEDAAARVFVIRKTLEAKIEKEFETDTSIRNYVKECANSDELIQSVVNSIDEKKITYEESKWLMKCLDDRLQYGYSITLKDVYQKLLDRINNGDFSAYKQVAEALYNISSSVVNMRRNTNSNASEMTFSLKEDIFANTINDAVAKLQDKNKVFITGIRRLNTILSPGYISKRLYLYLAFPGGGKSQMLLKAALDIKKYNAGVQPKDPEKTPAVLLITMENDIDETVERIFNMKVSADDIRNYTPKQVIRQLKEQGEMVLTDKNNIDIIIKYYPNRSIDTNDLYGIIKDLNDDGTEVIALVLDYIKRIRPAEKGATEKEELKNISNELKTLAKMMDIPVITAQQLNRTASSVVDAAIQNKKEDVTRLVGRDGVAGAWELIENSDVVIIINQEVRADTGDVFLTFKLLKRRYRSSETDEKLKRLDYFNHPYEKDNTIKLIDDVDLPKSLSLYSLATQFIALEDTKRGKANVVQRKEVGPESPEMEFEPFDFNKHDN